MPGIDSVPSLIFTAEWVSKNGQVCHVRWDEATRFDYSVRLMASRIAANDFVDTPTRTFTRHWCHMVTFLPRCDMS